MTSRLINLLLLATVTLSTAKILTRETNSDLQQTCGLNARYHTKVLNGEGPMDYPFAAVVNVKGVLTATVISPRHVLLFNVFEMNKDTGRVTVFNETEIRRNEDGHGVGHCDGDDWVFPEQANGLFHIKFAIEHFGAQATNKVSRVVVIGGCVELDTFKPLLLELTEDLTFDKTHGAICLPVAEEVYDEEYYTRGQEFTVFGMGPRGQALTFADYTKKECGKDHGFKNFVFCGTPVNESRGLCQGDFGGGAIATVEGRNVLLGIFAEGNIDCEVAPKDHQDPEFIDITKYTKQICRQTGVCSDDEYETTTDVPYVPSFTVPSSTVDPSIAELFNTEEPSTVRPKETIIAEPFEKMPLNCSANEHHEEKPKEVHIHIHLDKDVKVHFD